MARPHSQPKDRWKAAFRDALIVCRFSLFCFLKLLFYRFLISHKLRIVSVVSSLSPPLFSLLFPTLLHSSFSLARLFHLFFKSFILSGFHFVIFFLLLSPGCSLPLPPSLPPSVSTYLSFSFFLFLFFDYCLTFTLSLFHSVLPSLPLQSLSPSLF